MNKIIIYFLFATLLISCSKDNQKYFSITEINIPKYYEKYDYRKFWETQGYDFTFSNYNKDTAGRYKDSCSTNFLKIGDGYCIDNLLRMTRNERMIILRDELQLKLYKANEQFEIYKSNSIDTLPSKKILYRYYTEYISKKDSIQVGIQYESFDKDDKKLDDYNKIVKYIENKCDQNSTFTSTVARPKAKNWIAN